MGSSYRLPPGRSFQLARLPAGEATLEVKTNWRVGRQTAARPRPDPRAPEEFNARRVYRPDSVRQVALADDHSSARIIAEPL